MSSLINDKFYPVKILGGIIIKNSVTDKEIAVQKLIELPPEDVSKVLIFMAGLEAGCEIYTPPDALIDSTQMNPLKSTLKNIRRDKDGKQRHN